MTRSYVARVLAAVWLGAAALYGAFHLELSVWQFRGAVAAIVLADLWLTLRDREFRHWLWDTTFGQWRAIDAETDRAPEEAGRFSWLILAILVLVAVSLTLQEYIGDRSFFERTFPPRGHEKYWELESFGWWSGWRVFGYVVMPIAMLVLPRLVLWVLARFRIECARFRAALRAIRVRDFHVAFEGFFKHLWIYVVLFLCVLPAVLYASTTPAFRHTYPFYRLANRSGFDLWTWEALYAAQFVSLEFFFRGFILKGLRRALGSNAVFVMIVPYCMIHYGKPLPETLGAIGAGLILGTLAMRTKSIWGGVLIHIGVAMTMDVLALRGCPAIGSGHFCGD